MSDAIRPKFWTTLKAALLGGVIAAALNAALLFIARAAGVSMIGEYQPGQPALALPLPMLLVASLMPALVAGIAYYGLSRVTERAPRVFTLGATVLLLLSMGGPATLVGADAATRAVLALMHVFAAVAIVRPLTRVGRD